VGWLTHVLYAASEWLPWVLLTPILVATARRWRLDKRISRQSMGIHILVAVFILLTHVLLMGLFQFLNQMLAGWTPDKSVIYFKELPWLVPLAWTLRNSVVYLVILAVSYTADYRNALRDREMQAAKLETQLAKAQLHTLKSQLHPHFLFNAMNAISTLMRTDMDSAERMLDMLANLLRRSLRDLAVQVVPLHLEIDFVSAYLDIEMIRFPGRLRVEIDIDSEVKEALVPHLILQPLVENAVRHGIGPKVGSGIVQIIARREGENLSLQVMDDGVGPGNRRNNLPGEGVGLSNTRARLDHLFQNQAEMEFGPRPRGGFQVKLRFPLNKVAMMSQVKAQQQMPMEKLHEHSGPDCR
jgi:two-component system, LytTR family, sensor kinase